MTRDDSLLENGLSPRDFSRLAAFIQSVAGIKMPPGKHAMVEGRLRRRVAATGARSFSAYCDMVLSDGDQGDEVVNLIDVITTNKTDFFREPQHFEILAKQVLPALSAKPRPLKIWSAACSTGAEPYTLAMVLADFIETRRTKPPMQPAQILATDLCTKVLETARLAIYPDSLIDPIPHHFRSRFLLRGKGQQSGMVRMSPELRGMVRFGQMNLMLESYPVDPDFDVIFCRNVLIYFDRPTQQAVLKRLCDHLLPGGTLAVGHSEAVHNLGLPLTAIGHTIFRKLAA